MPANATVQKPAQQPYSTTSHASDSLAQLQQRHERDRRGERRFEVNWFLWAGCVNAAPVRGWAVNVSTGGMMVKLPVGYEPNALVEFEVWYAARQSIRVLCKIVWREYTRHAFVHGVEFLGMTEQDRKALGEELLRMRRDEIRTSQCGAAVR